MKLGLVLLLIPLSILGNIPQIKMGVIIKNNDRMIPTFLDSLASLDYPKHAIDLQIDVINNNIEIQRLVAQWISSLRGSYKQLKCHYHLLENRTQLSDENDPATLNYCARIKNDYLQIGKESDFLFILSSDFFLKPQSLKYLIKKDLPIVVPFVRPLPKPADMYRNFFVEATMDGFYKDHPLNQRIGNRYELGTFQVDCAHGCYLIQRSYLSSLQFIGERNDWDFLEFSRVAKKKQIPQYICNEKEFGFMSHADSQSLEDEKALFFPNLVSKVDRAAIQKEIALLDDAELKGYVNEITWDDYTIYPVENDLFLVDEKYDFIKNTYIKQGIPWEKEIAEKLKQYTKAGTIAIDLGGHIGIHTLTLSKLVGERGSVYVFEPQKKMFTELLANLQLNGCHNVKTFHLAVGAEEKWGALEINHNKVNEGVAQVGNGGEKIKIVALDSFNLDHVSIMKIDVEGYEMEVLKGAQETIKRSHPVIVIEILPTSERNEKIKRIEEMGYKVEHIKDQDYICFPS